MTPFEELVPRGMGSALRVGLCLMVLALLSACGTGYQTAGDYGSHRRGDYAPPGPAEDPWGPYIHEASAKYHVPQQWIRAVIRQESGGREYLNGRPITSNAGAMGLMQVMPSTYATLADRYSLGGDPYDPHDNIMAGTAYIREMYEQFGSPGFLAAYNAGPGRLSSHLATGHPLPSETVQYVASIAPRLGDEIPPSGEFAAYAANSRSSGSSYARSSAPVMMASIAANPGSRTAAQEAAWQTGGQSSGQSSGLSSGQSSASYAGGSADGAMMVASVAANPGSRSLAQEAAWQTAGSGSPPPVPATPAMSPAQDAAWQTSPGQYAAADRPAPAPAPASPPVMVASAEPVSPPGGAPMPPPVPYGAAPRYTPEPQYVPTPRYAAASSGSFLMASAQAAELPRPMRTDRSLPPPPPEPGVLGTLPIGRTHLPEPPPLPRLQLASASAGAAHLYGASAGGSWTIQVGAYATPALAHSMAENARHIAPDALHHASATVGEVNTSGGGHLYRARLTGLSSSAASSACSRLAAGHMSCVAVPPDERW